MQVRVAIVDDEPVAREILRRYLEDIPGLQLISECRDAFEATQVVTSQAIDLLLLDINLPRLSGISFARSVPSPPLIIFTTAYPEFAVEGFELDAVDYLVKPFSFERFLKAVNRAIERMPQRGSAAEQKRQVLIRADKKLYAIDPSTIQYAESVGDYIRIVSDQYKLLVHHTLARFTEELNDLPLIRIHRSFAVNPGRIDFIEGNRVSIAGKELPVSRDLREQLLLYLGDHSG